MANEQPKIEIRDITIELSTTNVIVTYTEPTNPFFLIKRGLSSKNTDDWKFVMTNSEILIPYINIAWKGATPILEESQNTETNE